MLNLTLIIFVRFYKFSLVSRVAPNTKMVKLSETSIRICVAFREFSRHSRVVLKYTVRLNAINTASVIKFAFSILMIVIYFQNVFVYAFDISSYLFSGYKEAVTSW